MAVDNQIITRVLIVGLAVAVLAVLIIQYQRSTSTPQKKEPFKPKRNEHFLQGSQGGQGGVGQGGGQGRTAISSMPATFGAENPVIQESSISDVMPSEPLSNESYRAVDYVTESKLPKEGCFPRDKTTAEDLLPKDAANSTWAQVAPAGQGDVSNQNFLSAGYMVGIDTVGQSMRNANYQLRSDIPNPRYAVGPWMQSTIEFDNSRRFFEIGTEGSC